jgi:hypothetical protein
MKEIDSEYLVKGNYYYIQDNSTKYIGSFSDIFHYNNFSIAVFDNVCGLTTNASPIVTKSFLLTDYYFQYTYFFIPQKEEFLLKQLLRQKIKDIHCVSYIVEKLYYQNN